MSTHSETCELLYSKVHDISRGITYSESSFSCRTCLDLCLILSAFLLFFHFTFVVAPLVNVFKPALCIILFYENKSHKLWNFVGEGSLVCSFCTRSCHSILPGQFLTNVGLRMCQFREQINKHSPYVCYSDLSSTVRIFRLIFFADKNIAPLKKN